jgi:hypothetical protein
MNITIKQTEGNRFNKDVFINGKCIGSVMADDKMTAKECYESLKNNWAIDLMESQHYKQLDRLENY